MVTQETKAVLSPVSPSPYSIIVYLPLPIVKYADRVNKITERLNDLHVSYEGVKITDKHRIRKIYEVGERRQKD